MSNVRFTAWLSTEERDKLHEVANAHGTSDNFILRIAVRSLLLDMPVPSFLQAEKVKNAPVRSSR